MIALMVSLPGLRVGRPVQLGTLGVLLVLALAGLRLWPDLGAWLRSDAATPAGQLAHLLLFELRLPRVLAAMVAGAALGLSGLLFQALTRNPLAAPDLLGVTGGAQLGVFAAIMLPALGGVVTVPLLFLCGLLGALLAMLTAGGWRASALQMILAGTACSLFFSAVSMVLLSVFEDDIASVALWSNGVLYQPGAEGLLGVLRWLCLPLALLPLLLRSLEVSALGDDAARTVGVPLQPLRLATMAVATLFAAGAISVAGPMGFVGLIAPNLLRAAGVHRLHRLAPLAALWGGLVLLAADSAVLALKLDATLSTGVMVAVVGTPLLLLLIHRNRFLAGAQPHSRGEPRFRLPFAGLVMVCVGLLVALAAFASAYGETWLSPLRWWDAALGRDAVAGLLVDLRLFRLLTAMLAGALLAASGALLQSVVRNPLAGPEVLGVTQGAGLAVLLALVGTPILSRPAMLGASLLGGAAVLAITLLLNRRHRLAALPVALTGIALGGLCAALSQWLIVQNSVEQARLLVWLVGGTYGRSAADTAALLPWLLLAVPLVYGLARPLDLLLLGEQSAAALGVPVARLRLFALVLATTLASAAVAVVGPVAFVGLVTPHFAKLLGFHAHRQRLPVAMLLGAILLGLADVLGRSVLAPTEIPAGAMTALIGAPYLLGMLVFGRRQRSAA
ncbi:MAG: Fe3+-hydroxamate ABC transporter permease FhuB [Burkholderiales bacterium RIFCSPLOWO2_12_FULL_64_99]|nr:MAG: Fe3+-hydroxamate ABC transporter permease FhuB [Burkholderiales bacterium RIFCSPLOWO2_12_FULL_64_99]